MELVSSIFADLSRCKTNSPKKCVALFIEQQVIFNKWVAKRAVEESMFVSWLRRVET